MPQMIMIEQMLTTGKTLDRLHAETGIPRFRLARLQAGTESLLNIPFYQGCELALALDCPLVLWYGYLVSGEYYKWLRSRRMTHG